MPSAEDSQFKLEAPRQLDLQILRLMAELGGCITAIRAAFEVLAKSEGATDDTLAAAGEVLKGQEEKFYKNLGELIDRLNGTG